MCGLFTYTYHEHEPNVGKYLIHLVFGYRNLIVNTLYTNLRFVCQAVGLQISGLHLSTVMMRDESPFFWFSMRLQDANLGGGRFTNRNLLFLGPEIFRAFQGVYLANAPKNGCSWHSLPSYKMCGPGVDLSRRERRVKVPKSVQWETHLQSVRSQMCRDLYLGHRSESS